MEFELSAWIERSPEDVFAFLRDKDRHPQEQDSPVLVLEKATPGKTGLGTRYREVVQMLPLLRGEILSEITAYDPPRTLEEDFRGAGMAGRLTYEFRAQGQGTLLTQRETLEPLGLLKLASPLIHRMLSRRLRDRLDDIKALLESGETTSRSSRET